MADAKRSALRSIRRRGQLAERGKAPTIVVALGKPDSDVVAPTDEKKRDDDKEDDMKTEKKKGGTKGKKKGKGGY